MKLVLQTLVLSLLLGSCTDVKDSSKESSLPVKASDLEVESIDELKNQFFHFLENNILNGTINDKAFLQARTDKGLCVKFFNDSSLYRPSFPKQVLSEMDIDSEQLKSLNNGSEVHICCAQIEDTNIIREVFFSEVPEESSWHPTLEYDRDYIEVRSHPDCYHLVSSSIVISKDLAGIEYLIISKPREDYLSVRLVLNRADGSSIQSYVSTKRPL